MIIMDAIRLLQHAKCARKQRDQVEATRGGRGRQQAGGSRLKLEAGSVADRERGRGKVEREGETERGLGPQIVSLSISQTRLKIKMRPDSGQQLEQESSRAGAEQALSVCVEWPSPLGKFSDRL